jgi:hypothetical protein
MGCPSSSSRIPKGSAIDGALLRFRPNNAVLAYERISNMEPDAQHRWDTVAVDPHASEANILVARQPNRGSARWDFESHEPWDGWRDPFFTERSSCCRGHAEQLA